MVTDPIADMLTHMRNAMMVKHTEVLMPSSKIKLSIARMLKREGFIEDFETLNKKPQPIVKIRLKYTDKQSAISGLERVSKPGLRVYVKRGEIPRVYGGLGIALISTSHGLMTGQEAWKKRLGGEFLCRIW